MTGHNEDAAWRDIVDNYGDRPLLDAADPGDPAADQMEREDAEPARPDVIDLDESPEPVTRAAPEERFVPPPPPPLPRLPPDRMAAWAGVFLAPAILLVATVLRLPLPSVIAWLLVAAFLGGFGYLVVQMPRGPRDPFDDGARL